MELWELSILFPRKVTTFFNMQKIWKKIERTRNGYTLFFRL